MKSIYENPFRIAGLFANASEREIVKQKGKLLRMAKIGRQQNAALDFPFMIEPDRTDITSVNNAFSKIEQNQDKLRHSLFWFVNGNTFDETAINYLINGDKEKAIEIWEKIINGKEVTSKNYSCFNNLGTIKLISDLKDEIKEGIEAKIKLIESSSFTDFVNAIVDQTYKTENQKQIEIFVDDILKQFNGKYSSSDILTFFENCNGATHEYLTKKFTEEPLLSVEAQIESCKKRRKENKGKAYDFGLRLFANTKDDLSLLKTLFGTFDLKYKTVADQLANEIMQCGIDYFNESQENDSSEDYLKQAQELNETALSIAVGKLTRDRAKESLATLEEMKDREVGQAIALLQSVKDAYETNEQKIRQQVNELKESDPLIRLGHRTINQTAVEDNIKNSIDWGKVNDLLIEILPDESLERIKASSNNELKSEFIELSYWLKDYSQSNLLIIRIIEDYKRIPPKLSFKILSSEITNTENKPLYTKFIRYIGLKVNIEVLEENSVTFYFRYINPRGIIGRNSKSSPKGYTRLETKNLNKNLRNISFVGWGHADECTYDIGEHKIEVYVDEYLIHTKKFKVDLAPSEKIKKEIDIAERKLKKIRQSTYYESELKTAENELVELHKFKLFRGSSEKQREIWFQQRIVDQIKIKAEDEKNRDIKIQEEKIYKLKMELSAQTY